MGKRDSTPLFDPMSKDFPVDTPERVNRAQRKYYDALLDGHYTTRSHYVFAITEAIMVWGFTAGMVYVTITADWPSTPDKSWIGIPIIVILISFVALIGCKISLNILRNLTHRHPKSKQTTHSHHS